jgi:hypothetical protein
MSIAKIKILRWMSGNTKKYTTWKDEIRLYDAKSLYNQFNKENYANKNCGSNGPSSSQKLEGIGCMCNLPIKKKNQRLIIQIPSVQILKPKPLNSNFHFISFPHFCNSFGVLTVHTSLDLQKFNNYQPKETQVHIFDSWHTTYTQ